MEGFIKFVKQELTTMRHDPAFLSTVLKKLLRTHCIGNINSNNSINKMKGYARTSYVKPLKMSEDVAMALDDNLALSSVVDKDGKVYLCTRARAAEGGGYKLFNPESDNSNGERIYGLHYAPATITPSGPHRCISDATQLEQFATDYIIMMRREAKWTVLCRSWKVRNKRGEFEMLQESLENFVWAFK